MNEANRSNACDDGACECRVTSLDRRELIKLGMLSAAVAAGLGRAAMAGPFTSADFDKLVPTGKRARSTSPASPV